MNGTGVVYVCGEHGKVVFKGRGSDERVAHLQAVAQGGALHQICGAQRDGRGKRQQPG